MGEFGDLARMAQHFSVRAGLCASLCRRRVMGVTAVHTHVDACVTLSVGSLSDECMVPFTLWW